MSTMDGAKTINVTNMKSDENAKREAEFQALWGHFDRTVKQKFPQATQVLTLHETLRNANVEGVNYPRLEELRRKHVALCGEQKETVIGAEDIQYLRQLIDIVEALTTAYDDCTKLEKSFKCYLKDRVSPVVDEMIGKAYLRVPIIDDDNKLVAVFSASTMSELSRLRMGIVEDRTFKDIEQLVGLEAYSHLAVYGKEKFVFAPKNIVRSELQKLIGSPKTQDDMIFVTEHGDSSEPILGVITVRDIHDLLDSKSETK